MEYSLVVLCSFYSKLCAVDGAEEAVPVGRQIRQSIHIKMALWSFEH